MGNEVPKLTHLILLVFVIFAAHDANALNLAVGPEKPRDFALAERADPFGRTVSSYIIPEKWTDIVSPLNDLKVMQDWSLTEASIYQEIASLNPETRLLGPANHPSKEHCRRLLVEDPEKFIGAPNIIGAEENEARFGGCLTDLRTRAYEGDTDWMVEIFEAWATMDFKQPRKQQADYDWFRVINYSATLYALYKDEVGFSQNFKSWLSKILEQTELKNFDTKNNTFLARGIVQDAKIWANDCSTTRFIYTQAYLLGGLALEDQEIFDEGIDSLQYILSAFDKNNVYPCWAMRGIRATSYHNQIPVWLTSFHAALDTLGYDLFEHEMPNGSKVHEAAKTTFDLIWSDDLGPILDYAQINLGVPENRNWQDLKLPLEKRNKNYLPMKPQTIVRNSMHFVDRYAPELKLKYGYEPFHDNKVLGETVLTAYHDPEWVNLFMGDAVLDLDALFRVNGFGVQLARLDFSSGSLVPDFDPEILEYSLSLTGLDVGVELDFGPKITTDEVLIKGSSPSKRDTGYVASVDKDAEEFVITVSRGEGKKKQYIIKIKTIKNLTGRFECKFNLRRKTDGQTDADLASGRVRIVKGNPLFRNVTWKSGNGRVPENHLRLNSSLVVTEEGKFIGSAPIFTNYENEFVEDFNFGGQFEKDGSLILEGFHTALSKDGSKDGSKGISVELDIYACYLVPDVVVEKPQPSEEPSEEKFAFKPVSVDFTPLSIEFYGLFENDEFMNFKGEIKDSEGQQFGDGKLNIGLMFDFRNLKKKQKNIVRDYKISVNVDGLDGVTNIEDIRSCEKAFWEDDGQIKQVYIRMKHLEENKCVFEKLPEDTVAILQRLATNMAEILERATFEDQSWNERVTTLSSKFH